MLNRYVTATLFTLLLLGACSDGSDSSSSLAAPSHLTVVPTAAPEGAPGEMPSLSFRVTLTEPQPEDVEIRYETVAVTATADEDYLQTAGELVIQAGDIEGFINVDMIGDAEEEDAETFTLDIAVAGNVETTAGQVTGTIANDDTSCDEPVGNNPNPWLVNGADPLSFAHRGGVTDFPENTLYAYSEAARLNIDVLEMDVFQTLDGYFAILHDAEGVDRTTNGSGRITDMTLQEAQALDAAYWFIPGEGTVRDRPEEDYPFRGIATGDKSAPPGYSAEDFRIPTLTEVLSRFPHKLLNIELKNHDDNNAYEQQMADLLQRYGRFTDVIAASFDDVANASFKAIAPCVYTSVPFQQGFGMILASAGDAPMPPAPEHIAFQAPIDTDQIKDRVPEGFYLEIVTPDFVADSHAVNLAVHVWTVDSCEDMLHMIDLGVDAIMTDQPVLLASILDTAPQQRSCD